MIPVLFAYGGWQTANFLASEIRDPRKLLNKFGLPRTKLSPVFGALKETNAAFQLFHGNPVLGFQHWQRSNVDVSMDLSPAFQ
jgi:hypothetical protein